MSTTTRPAPAAAPTHATLGANLLGALNGAVSCIATTLAAATLVFAPLGPAYLPHAVLACLVGAIAGGLLAAILASTPVAISSPRTAQCVVIAALVAALARDVAIPAPQFIIALTCLATLLAGLMQIAGGIFRVGQLVRFVPYPVIAGFTHGISVILFVVYIPMVRGTAEVPSTVEGGARRRRHRSGRSAGRDVRSAGRASRRPG